MKNNSYPSKMKGCIMPIVAFLISFTLIMVFSNDGILTSLSISTIISILYLLNSFPSSPVYPSKEERHCNNKRPANMITPKQQEQESASNVILEEGINNLQKELDSVRKKLTSNNEQ